MRPCEGARIACIFSLPAFVDATYASQSGPLASAACNNVASFSAALSTATAATSRSDAQGSKQADFSSMTHQQMQQWSNEQIRSGKMTLDEGRPFMAMSMHIAVGGGTGGTGGTGGASGELPAGNDDERVDFAEKVRAGIAGAMSRNDDGARKMLESALKLMQQYQGQTIGVDKRA